MNKNLHGEGFSLKLREKVWLWGLDPGADHFGGENGLAGSNRMTPMEGAYYFGTRNLLRVSRFGFPKPPLDNEAEKLSVLDRTVWSIDPADPDSVDELIRIARYYPNIRGALILADGEHRGMLHTRDVQLYREARARIKEKLGEDFQIWLQISASKIVVESQLPYLETADVLNIWLSTPQESMHLDTYLGQLTQMGLENKKTVWGLYFWNFARKQIFPPAMVDVFLNKYREWLQAGRIEGIALYSNTLADTKLGAAFAARDWMAAHGDDEIPGGEDA